MILTVRPRFVFDLVDDDSPLLMPPPRRAAGSPLLLEQALILSVGRIVGAKRIFEIGTFRGTTTRMLAMNFPQADIATLDMDPSQSDERLTPFIGQITRHKGHSGNFVFAENSRDLVFVDGGHDYETVKTDTQSALKMLPKEGRSAVLWHDYNLPQFGVTRALQEFGETNLLYHVADTTLCIMARGWEL
jgi:Methyltransferase domain